ncbi:HTH cro/C1-type domain-containing protein OS=Streptomyces glaucescens OX=1907 GN=SGLAU_20740 PE=4 SV=1 [Streptomyces glaucescens]
MRRTTMFAAGAVGVLVVAAAAFWVTSGRGADERRDASAVAHRHHRRRAAARREVHRGRLHRQGRGEHGVQRQPGDHHPDRHRRHHDIEVRYSRACGAAWGRITQAAQGDQVEVSTDRSRQQGSVAVAGDRSAYTPMVAVKDAGEANACVTLASGEKGCTRQP